MKKPKRNTSVKKTDASTDKGSTGKHKSGRKRKLTKAEKIDKDFQKLALVYKQNKTQYNNFIDRMDKWLTSKINSIDVIFRTIDKQNAGSIPYAEFKAGMLDFHIPCNLIEMHIICKLFDTDGNGEIDHAEFEKGVKYFRAVEEASNEYDDDDKEVIDLLGPWHKWINLTFRFLTFDNMEDHPGHFEAIVTTMTQVQTLINLIIKTTHVASSNISLYLAADKSSSYIMNPTLFLMDYHLKGGTTWEPKNHTLYYDYNDFIHENPILMCDHYIMRIKRLTIDK